jgi:succinoglycan biosynthesis protein ExoO
MHPDRLERLLANAEHDGADIAADDLMIFDDTGMTPPVTCLPRDIARDARWIDAATYITCNAVFGRDWSLGYLKPLIRARTLHATGVRYDPNLRVGEDYDFVLRILGHHARFRIYPVPTYFYRRHGASISHRLSLPVLQALLSANARFRAATFPAAHSPLDTALAARERMLVRALTFEKFAAALRAGDLRGAIAQAWRDPAVVLMLRGAIRQRLQRLWRRIVPTAARKPPDGGICVLSRQRIVGNSNGSSAYLLSLCEALYRDGHALHLLCPSPAVYGRWPALVMGREMAVFRSIKIRGALRIGNVYIATDPTILRRAFVGILGKVLDRFGIHVRALSTPAPYSIGLPWQPADLRYVARHAPRRADGILADYFFLTEGIPYVLGAEGPSAVVMHDLFSSRPAQFGPLGAEDTVSQVDEDAEMKMLGRADAVIAIQEEEAARVRRRLPRTPVLLAPMATTPAAAPQPGTGSDILFIGSNTSPNVDGLHWFFNDIWPSIRRLRPAARLHVAGNVAGSFREIPDRVIMHGRVNDLRPLYASAAVVVSPLRAGSGLKIKLIEALGHGKAIVATSTTLQGVTEVVGAAVVVADDAQDFAGAVAALLSDAALRARHGASALEVVRQHFSAVACYASVVEFFAGATAYSDCETLSDHAEAAH